MKKMLEQSDYLYRFFSGLIGAIVMFFAPIFDMAVLVIAVILIDMTVGIWTARKVRGEGIKAEKLWNTVYKIILALTVVFVSYSTVKVTGGYQKLPNLLTGLICGFELWSIASNAALITNHPVFRLIKKMMENKVGLKDMENE